MSLKCSNLAQFYVANYCIVRSVSVAMHMCTIIEAFLNYSNKTFFWEGYSCLSYIIIINWPYNNYSMYKSQLTLNAYKIISMSYKDYMHVPIAIIVRKDLAYKYNWNILCHIAPCLQTIAIAYIAIVNYEICLASTSDLVWIDYWCLSLVL